MINRAAMSMLGSVPVERAALAVTSQQIRVLAYHGVDDVAAFERHLQILRARYDVIDPATFMTQTREPAPHAHGRPAVLLTFDDGSPTVIQHALPLLDRYRFKAVMFICPGLVDTSDGYWWQTVLRAVDRGMAEDLPAKLGLVESASAQTIVTALKHVDDEPRRALVSELAHRLGGLDESDDTWCQLSREDMNTWIAAGHTIGNHTWDHPILPMCTADEQRRQVDEAHTWLADRMGGPPDLFAYPNGDWADAAEERLRALRYRAAFLFDHRINTTTLRALRVSRLRVDATAGEQRFRAIASGVHSGIFHRVRSG